MTPSMGTMMVAVRKSGIVLLEEQEISVKKGAEHHPS